MTENDKKSIENIIGELGCSKDLRCCKSGLDVLCKARDVGTKSILECLEDDPEECHFSFALFGYGHLCKCPLRVYIAEQLENNAELETVPDLKSEMIG